MTHLPLGTLGVKLASRHRYLVLQRLTWASPASQPWEFEIGLCKPQSVITVV